MITEAILRVLALPFTFLLNLIPSFTLPSIFSTVVATSSSGLNSIGKVSFFMGEKLGLVNHWVDGSTLFLVVPAVGAAWAFSITVRVVRMIVSVLTGGGGATA